MQLVFLNKHNLRKIEVLIENVVGKSSSTSGIPRNFSWCGDISKLETGIRLETWVQTKKHLKCLKQKIFSQNNFLLGKYDRYFGGKFKICNVVLRILTLRQNNGKSGMSPTKLTWIL